MHQNEALFDVNMAASTRAPRPIRTVARVATLTRVAHGLSRDLRRGGLPGLIGLASRGVGIAVRYPAHRRWLAVLGGETTRKLLTIYPRIAYRHSTTYLFQNTTWQQRMAMLMEHYTFLNRTHGPAFFEATLEPEGVPVWHHATMGRVLSIGLQGPCLTSRHREGELTLAFRMDGLLLYQIAFSMVSTATSTLGLGRSVAEADDALVIGMVQGAAGHLDQQREAAKLCKAIAPRDLLMSAVAGVAEAWGITRVVGITDARRLSRPSAEDGRHDFAYDPFWTQYRAEITADGHAVMTLPFHEGPLGGNSSAHRRRTAVKRRFKASVSEAVAAVIVANRRPRTASSRHALPLLSVLDVSGSA